MAHPSWSSPAKDQSLSSSLRSESVSEAFDCSELVPEIKEKYDVLQKQFSLRVFGNMKVYFFILIFKTCYHIQYCSCSLCAHDLCCCRSDPRWRRMRRHWRCCLCCTVPSPPSPPCPPAPCPPLGDPGWSVAAAHQSASAPDEAPQPPWREHTEQGGKTREIRKVWVIHIFRLALKINKQTKLKSGKADILKVITGYTCTVIIHTSTSHPARLVLLILNLARLPPCV